MARATPEVVRPEPRLCEVDGGEHAVIQEQPDAERGSKGQLLSHRATQVTLTAAGVAAIALGSASNGRSFALMSLVGLWAIPFGWAMLTNAGGTWDRHVARQHRRRERLSRVPLGRLYWSVDRQDHEIHRAFIGISGILAGLAFIALGVLAGLDVIDVNGH